MKLFLSWSGDTSKQVANELREWIPLILQNVKPFLSPADIEKGGRWQGEISRELNECNFGLICLTRGNLKSQWLAFEAGALSKNIEGKAATLLLGINHSDVQYPLGMFQGSLFTKDDVLKLIKDINKSVDHDLQRPDAQIDQLFDNLWPNLKTKVELILKTEEAISADDYSDAPETVNPISEHIEELLILARQQNRVLSSPDEFFKPLLRDISELIYKMNGDNSAASVAALKKKMMQIPADRTEKTSTFSWGDFLVALERIQKNVENDGADKTLQKPDGDDGTKKGEP